MRAPILDERGGRAAGTVPMLRKCRIEVEDFGEIRSQRGPLYLEVLNARGIDLHNDCGGQLKCGKCRIVFVGGAPEILEGDRRHLNRDELSAGVRLACIHQVEIDCRIIVPPAPSHELLDDLEG
jgi:Na+-transporting NADH:ubiquinone oxidoreductase subunit NqrF